MCVLCGTTSKKRHATADPDRVSELRKGIRYSPLTPNINMISTTLRNAPKIVSFPMEATAPSLVISIFLKPIIAIKDILPSLLAVQ